MEENDGQPVKMSETEKVETKRRGKTRKQRADEEERIFVSQMIAGDVIIIEDANAKYREVGCRRKERGDRT